MRGPRVHGAKTLEEVEMEVNESAAAAERGKPFPNYYTNRNDEVFKPFIINKSAITASFAKPEIYEGTVSCVQANSGYQALSGGKSV